MKPYQKRLFKEFKELTRKCEKLDAFIKKVKEGEVEADELDCPLYMLERQLDIMVHYASILMTRIRWKEGGNENAGNGE